MSNVSSGHPDVVFLPRHMPDIFISYSRKNSEQAQSLALRLRASGSNVWMDTASLAAAETWSAAIVSAIRDCKIFIVLLSADSVGSHNVTRELALASERNKSIVAIELGEVLLNDTMEYSLAGLHRIRYTDEEALTRTFGKLGIVLSSGPSRKSPSHPHSDKKRLAVIPFEDLSQAKDQEWFSDGLAYELIDTLTKVEKIFVVDKQTIREYKRTALKSKELAGELGVRFLVFGAVLKSADKLRIQASLVDSETGETLWNFKHTGALEDVFDIQEKVSKQIADELQVKLSPHELQQIEERVTENAEAYELFLRADDHYLCQTKHDLEAAVRLYHRAGEIDPSCSYAYFGSANSLLAIYRSYNKSETILAEAEADLNTAIGLRPTDVRSRSILALLHHYKGMDEEAISLARQAIAMEPDNPISHFHLGFLYMNQQKNLLAAEEFETVLKNQPRNL
ncbi:MAG: TIR domain-containing protein, partial [Ignavibacteriota bacterium]